MVGIVLSAYAIPQVILRIPIGILSDRLGRRKLLVAGGIIFTSIGALGLGLSTTPWFLFISRMITGIGAASWVVIPLYFSAYFPASESGKAIGINNFVRNLALISATASGGLIAEIFGLSSPFFIAALLGVLAFFALILTKEPTISRISAQICASTISVATRPLLLMVSLMSILLYFSTFTGVFGFTPIYAAGIGASSSQLGLITMINLGSSAIGTLTAVWIWERIGYRSTMFWSALLIASSMFAIPYITTVPVLMAVQIIGGLGSGILSTLFMVLSIRGLPQRQQATAMGIYQAIYAIGMLAGPLSSGFISSNMGLSTVFYLSASLVIPIAILAFTPIFSKDAIE